MLKHNSYNFIETLLFDLEDEPTLVIIILLKVKRLGVNYSKQALFFLANLTILLNYGIVLPLEQPKPGEPLRSEASQARVGPKLSFHKAERTLFRT